MKTLTKKMLTVTMMFAASAMVACSKGSNDSVASTPLTGLAGCVSGCPVGGVSLQSLNSRYGNDIVANLQLIGTPSGYGYGGGSSQIGFGGSVVVQSYQGALLVGMSCAVQNGTYSINTVQGGTMNYPVFQGVRLHAQGINVPASFDFTVYGGSVTGTTSAEMSIFVERATAANGVPCSGDGYWGSFQLLGY